MKLIIREAKVVCAQSPYHNEVVDVLIENGIIKKVGNKISDSGKATEVRLENLHISEGWFDSSVSFGEPGFEARETIANGLETAARSGFAAVALQPNSEPVTDGQSQVNFVKMKSAGFATEIYPIGALTKQSAGKDIAELFDMKNAGAIAFGDYNKSIDNPNLLKIALQYVQDFGALVIAYARDKDIAANGVMNEGVVSTRLGMKGIPALAEELHIARNLFLLEYTGGRMHIPTISTVKSVRLIKDAKAKGLNVSCSVAVHHLAMTEEKLDGFDTRYKIMPPLRTELDRKALLKGVIDGTIDMITCDHNPIDIEHKKMEFDFAENGTIGLESAFGALNSLLSLETTIQKLTSGKTNFGIRSQPIVENTNACITLFNPDGNWTFGKENILSKSGNSAFLNVKMKGKAYGILNQGKLVLNP